MLLRYVLYLFVVSTCTSVYIALSAKCRSKSFKNFSPDLILEYAPGSDVQTSSDIHSSIQCATLCLASLNCNMFTFTNEKCSVFRKIGIGAKITNTSYHPVIDCPKGFTYDAGVNLCLKVIIKNVNYTQALSECRARKTELLRVDSSQKQTYIQRILDGVSGEVIFIQGTYDPTTDKYYYDNGDEMVYTNWNMEKNQPDKQSGENFIGMRKYHSYRWHDFFEHNDCDGFICEKKSTTICT